MNQYFKKIIFFLICWTISWRTVALESPFIFFEHYTNENGLPQNSVKSIAADNYGFVWLATEQGLVRYDGKNFKLFNNQSKGSSYFRPILILSTYPKNNLYAYLEDEVFLDISHGKLVESTGDVADTFSFSHSKIWTGYFPYLWDYNKQYKDYADTVYIYLGSKRFARIYDNKKIEFFDDKVLYNTVTNPAFTTDTRRYFTMEGNLYNLHNHNLYEAIEILPNAQLIQRVIYGDILKLNSKATIFPFYNSGSNQMFFYQQDHLFYVTIDERGNLYTELLLSGFGLEKKQIRSAYYNKDAGKLFLGSAYYGFYVFNRKVFSVIKAPTSITENNVYYTLMKWGNQSFVTNNGLMVHLSDLKNYSVSPILPNAGKEVYNIIRRDYEGKYWVSAKHGIYYFDENFKIIKDFEHLDLNQIEFLDAKSMLITINQQDNLIYKGTLINNEIMLEPYLDFGNKIQNFQKIGNILWVALHGRFFKVNLTTDNVELIPELNDKFVRFIKADDDAPEKIWIGTYGNGLYYYDGKFVFSIPYDKHEYLRYINSIQEDKGGFFWISTNNGIFQILKIHLKTFPRRKEDLVYLHYSKNNGFNSNEFNGGSSNTSVRLDNGIMAFSSIDGIVAFDPQEIKYSLPNNPIILDELSIDGEYASTEDSLIKFPNGFHRINIKVTSPYYGSNNNVNYEYSLNGSEWTSMRGDVIEFNELPSGYNQLEVRRKSNFNGDFNILSLQLFIIPYWWQSTWFIILAIFAALYLISLFVRMRLKILNQINDNLQIKVAQRTEDLNKANADLELSQSQLRKQLSLQKLLNENISHDIKTPLRYLSFSLRKLRDKVQEGYMPATKELKMLVDSSEKIYHYTEMVTQNFKELLNLYHISYVDVGEIMKEKVQIFHNALDTNNITPIVEAEDVVLYSRKEIMSTIIHNLLDNCIKNTHNGNIFMRAFDMDERVEINISDTGKGFDIQHIESYNIFLNDETMSIAPTGIGVGFLMIKEILPIINGRIHISINKYGGTTFTVVIQKVLDDE